MLGLALSMGASGVLLPRHGDEAAAAEPKPTEAVAAPQPSQQAIAHSPATVEAEPTINSLTASDVYAEHVVREGQTLWQISELYRVDIDVIAAANELKSSATLYVGQVLKIPGVYEAIDSVPVELASTRVTSAAVGVPLATANPAIAVSDDVLRREQQESVQVLQQRREQLRASLNSNVFTGSPRPQPVTAGDKVPDMVAAMPSPANAALPAPGASDKPATVLPLQVEGDRADSSIALAPTVVPTVVPTMVPSVPEGMVEVPTVPTDVTGLPSVLGLPAEPSSSQVALGTLPSLTDEHLDSASALSPSATMHEVRPGETIASLARTYNIPASMLIQENRLSNPDFILVGQVLRLPTPSVVQVTEEPASLIAAAPTEPVFVDPAVISDRSTPSQNGVALRLDSQQDSEQFYRLPTTEQESQTVLPSLPPVVTAPTSVGNESSTTLPGSSALGASPIQLPQPQAETPSYINQLLTDVNSLREQTREQRSSLPVQAPVQESLVIAESQGAASLDVEAVSSRLAPAEETTEVALASTVRPAVPSPSELQLAPSDETNERTGGRSPSGTSEDSSVAVVGGPSGEVASPADADLVAVAPLGVENYRSIAEPITGRMVSPDLPPLSDAGSYLPGGSQLFDGYIWPSTGLLTSGYGWRWGRMHRGIDIAAPIGTPIVAAAPGVVEFSGWNSGGYGNMVEIRHADGSMTRYAHNSRNLVQAGQQVEQGQQIAEMGSTGYSTGPHVHFEVHLPDQGTVNPMAYLPPQ